MITFYIIHLHMYHKHMHLCSSPGHSTLFLSFQFYSIHFHFILLERRVSLKLTKLISQHSLHEVWKVLPQTVFILPGGCVLRALLSVSDLTSPDGIPSAYVPHSFKAWHSICFLSAHKSGLNLGNYSPSGKVFFHHCYYYWDSQQYKSNVLHSKSKKDF